MSKNTVVAGVLMSMISTAVAGRAQYLPGVEAGAAQSGLTMDLVKTGIYTISGGGGNSVLRLTSHGLILVDGKIPGTYNALQAQIGRVSKQPVLVLVNTDSRTSSTGNNAEFRAAGTALLGHENLIRRTAGAAAPGKMFDGEFKMQIGEIEVQALHFGSAHTDADSIVYFPNLKTVAVGALFTAAPSPDYSAGGSLRGWSHTLTELLKVDFDTAIPAAGPVVTRLQVEALRGQIDAFVARGAEFVQRGGSKDQLLAAVRHGVFGYSPKLSDDSLSGLYAELTADTSGPY